MIGKELVIGKKHAKHMRYHAFVGCTGVITYFGDDVCFVKLTSVKSEFLRGYINEIISIHPEDALCAVSEAIEETDRLMMEVGNMIQVKDTFAKQMDYIHSVGHDGIVQHKEQSYAEILMISGPEAGCIKDIHIQDCYVPSAEEGEEPLFILIDHCQEEIYYADSLEPVELISKSIRGRIATLEKRADLSHVIGRYGFIATPAQESRYMKEKH